MENTKQKWKKFEDIVQDYIQKKWYKIITTNFYIKWWEIDIIAIHNWIICFVEVKWSIEKIDFQDYITPTKISHLKKAAKTWIYRNPGFDWKWYRFDLALVIWNKVDYIENFLF